MSFAYHDPSELQEALSILKEEGSIPYAGGTDILVNLKKGNLKARALVDLKNIGELREIQIDDQENLVIGSMATMREIYEHDYANKNLPAIAQAAKIMGCREIQNRATIGGNLANSSPSAETAMPLLVYDADIEIVNENGRYRIPLQQFFLGPGKNTLQKGEIIAKVIIKKENIEGSASWYVRKGRVEGMDLAAIGLAIWHHPNRAVKFRVAGGAVLPMPSRLYEVENYLNGVETLSHEEIAKIQDIYAQSIKPRASSLRGSPSFKKLMGGHLLAEALLEVVANRP